MPQVNNGMIPGTACCMLHEQLRDKSIKALRIENVHGTKTEISENSMKSSSSPVHHYMVAGSVNVQALVSHQVSCSSCCVMLSSNLWLGTNANTICNEHNNRHCLLGFNFNLRPFIFNLLVYETGDRIFSKSGKK